MTNSKDIDSIDTKQRDNSTEIDQIDTNITKSMRKTGNIFLLFFWTIFLADSFPQHLRHLIPCIERSITIKMPTMSLLIPPFGNVANECTSGELYLLLFGVESSVKLPLHGILPL